jgi:polyhydroxyalkanoate synthase subunit PhaC
VIQQRASKIGRLDRRLAPRPLPAHLTATTMLWLSSRAALPILKNVSLPPSELGKRLRTLVAEIDAFGSDSVAAALDSEIADRAALYLAGLEGYRRHPFRRSRTPPPVLWGKGTTRLLDYGCNAAAGPAVLVVPSLINRYYVLDILPERSFLRHLDNRGLRPVVVDWGAPGSDERDFDLTAYIRRLETALTAALQIAGAPIGVIGYCMGGLLALALALRRQSEVACLALLATPWDFHAEHAAQVRMLARASECLAAIFGPQGSVPVEAIQGLFLALDPFTAERKFTRFAALDPESEAARTFVAVEDWLNDGVPLVPGVARECAYSWYGENEPGQGRWRVGDGRVDPRLLHRPALVVIPRRDRIVPPSSAEPLGAQLGATVLRPPLGHVGMMSAARAPSMLWTPIAEWLRSRLEHQ